jgi:rhodanese-related sulfurtransferase
MVSTISPREAAELMSRADVDVVDVREAREWSTGHVPNARLVPLDELRAHPETLRGGTIVFICAKGQRSLTAAKLAERLGYQDLYSVDGGTSGWTKAGLPLVVDQQKAA